MKAIKDYKWKVEIIKSISFIPKEYYWKALNYHHSFIGGRYYKSEKSAKRNWEKFAKINGIKHWRYV